MPDVVPLKGMTRDQVCELLGRAKVYIDFGEHPGPHIQFANRQV